MKRFLIVLLFAVPAAAQPFVLAPQSPVSAPRMKSSPSSCASADVTLNIVRVIGS